MTETEARTFAERCVDWLLGSVPAYEMAMQIFVNGMKNPEQAKMGMTFMHIDPNLVDLPAMGQLAKAIENRDREIIIQLFQPIARSFSKDEATRFREKLDGFPILVREHFATMARNIKLKAGPKRRANIAEYVSIAALGDRLVPVIEKLLQELSSGTKHTLHEQLEFWKTDQPEECAFLLCHLDRLDSILKDAKLLKRANRLKARSRLIADAMAGADHKYAPRTSVERARQGRRALNRAALENSLP